MKLDFYLTLYIKYELKTDQVLNVRAKTINS